MDETQIWHNLAEYSEKLKERKKNTDNECFYVKHFFFICK